MAKEMPWMDICTSEQWSETVNKFASGKTKSRGKNFVNVMRFLLSEEADFVCGSVFFVDGGTDAMLRNEDF